MSQQKAPMIINLPAPASNPDTPNDMPGTPTSTTTSLSALSTTAIKDGHRGHAQPPPFGGQRGHHHHASTNSLEAERADRISRLAGLERVSTIRAPAPQQGNASSSPQTTPTSTGFLGVQPQQATNVTPAYFDNNGQPTATTKMSTVGTASATGSVGARTTTEVDDNTEVDEDFMSMDTNYRTMDVDSASGVDPMDEDLTSRSVGGFEDRLEDRMSDDGTASLVGFGEGANSTVSGPIYHRRPLPGTSGATGPWGLERSSSTLSEAAMLRAQDRRDAGELREAGQTPASLSAQAERRDARMMDGVSVNGSGHTGTADDDVFIDTTTRGPIPVHPGRPQQPSSTSRDAAERILRERLDGGEGRMGSAPPLSSPKGDERLGKFYFEDKK